MAPRILPQRERARVRNGWLRERLDAVLPTLMEREGFDCWIVAAREYNEDPVIMTLLPEPMMYARRRTILVFFRQDGGGLERWTLSRYPMVEHGPGGTYAYYQGAWDPATEEQWACLARLVRERDPGSIGVNVSETFAFGDGLSHSEHGQMAAALGPEYAGRMRGAERLAVGWLERRIPGELAAYGGIVGLAHEIVAEAFSGRVILPGVTTTEDVVWWMRQKTTDLGLRAWFQPSVSIQAPGLRPPVIADRAAPERRVILPGDLLHCDFGLEYLGLCTDTQQNAYVLRPGEAQAPQGLEAALAGGNRLQDLHLEMMVEGRSGNQVLRLALAQATAEGLRPAIYTHALGYHGHGAGPVIGLWDQQEGVPGRGDYPLGGDTVYSIELNVVHPVPEWGGQEVRMALEEDVALVGGRPYWLDGRQTQLHLIG